mgnify:CR=1 FL=1
MARLQTNLSLSEDTLIKADQLMIAIRKSSGAEVSRTTLVTELINQAHDQLKRIVPIRLGKRVVAWDAYYGDHFVGQFGGAGAKPDAERALDAFVFEELSK